ncbi:MAG: 6-pyruvoyl tetrahydropterin synthase family protein [Euryarchaeota archaeon]|nr:6-pyruvoyl tetrahydropterin synthase family protein [Euryarchaeota archaeon]
MTFYVYIDGWKRNIRFSAAHWVERAGKCERLHGHDYYVSIKLYGPVSDDGMIVDFSIVKSALKKIVEELDHKVLVPEKKVTKREDGLVFIKKDDKIMCIPEEDVKVLPIEVVTAEELAKYVAERLYEMLSDEIRRRGIYQIEICIDEGGGQEACHVKKLFA